MTAYVIIIYKMASHALLWTTLTTQYCTKTLYEVLALYQNISISRHWFVTARFFSRNIRSEIQPIGEAGKLMSEMHH